MELYPPHDKNVGPFPSRTIEQVTDDAFKVLTAGARGTDGEKRRAAELMRNFDDATPTWGSDNAHALVDLLNECIRCLQVIQSPFESYLEAPEPIVALYRVHGQRTRTAADELTAQTRLLMRDVTKQLVASIPWETLIELGFGGSERD